MSSAGESSRHHLALPPPQNPTPGALSHPKVPARRRLTGLHHRWVRVLHDRSLPPLLAMQESTFKHLAAPTKMCPAASSLLSSFSLCIPWFSSCPGGDGLKGMPTKVPQRAEEECRVKHGVPMTPQDMSIPRFPSQLPWNRSIQ